CAGAARAPRPRDAHDVAHRGDRARSDAEGDALGLGDDPRVARLARSHPEGRQLRELCAHARDPLLGDGGGGGRGPTDAERAEIDRLLEEAVGAGACGWSLQRMGPDTAQTDFDGTPMATDT